MTPHASWGEGEDLILSSVASRDIWHISASWLYSFLSLLLLCTFFFPLAGTALHPGYPPPTPMWWDAARSHTRPQSSTALWTRHGDFCTRTGWWRTGVTARSDEQTLQPSTSNPNRSCHLFLYLQSVPYTLDHKLPSQIRFHIFVGHLKNCDLMRCDLGKNSEEHLPRSGLLCKGFLLLLGLSRCSLLQIPAFSFTTIMILL